MVLKVLTSTVVLRGTVTQPDLPMSQDSKPALTRRLLGRRRVKAETKQEEEQEAVDVHTTQHSMEWDDPLRHALLFGKRRG